MIHINRVTLIGIALLTACADQGDPKICGPLPEQKIYPNPSWMQQRDMLGACITNWAARMSRAPDPSAVIAEAVVAQCVGAIEYEVQLGNKEHGWKQDIPGATAYWQKQALARVIQWRAGRCPI